MKFLLFGLIGTLLLTMFMFAFMTSAIYVELRAWVASGRSAHRNRLQ